MSEKKKRLSWKQRIALMKDRLTDLIAIVIAMLTTTLLPLILIILLLIVAVVIVALLR